MSEQACETPLVDLLRDVPENHRTEWEIMDGAGHSMCPIGRLSRRAADEIERLTAENERLRDACQRILEGDMGYPEDLQFVRDALASTRQEPDIHRGRFHHPDCNYWKWDWRYSWDVTDCNCEDVAGPTEADDNG